MEELFYTTVIYSAFAATSFLLLTKWRVIQYLQAHSSGVINKAANCTLCTCFWLCVLYTLLGLIFGAGLITLLAPLSGAALTRAIIG